jgi:hypothetical protein
MSQSPALSDVLSFEASRPARSRFAAAICADSNYLPYALFVAQQLRNLHDMESLDIVLCLTDDCEIPATLADLDFRVCKLSLGDVFTDLFLDARRTATVYSRLALPHLFQGDYERILYLDCDVFLLSGELSRLFAIDMGGRAVAAVRDIPQWSRPNRLVKPFAELGIPAAKYLNSGVLLIDTAAYVAQDLFQRCLDFGRQNTGHLREHDQQLLNCVLQGDWVELSPVWNWQRPVFMPYSEVMLPVVIAHFIGIRKPWKDPTDRVPPKFKTPLNHFLRRHFPGHPVVPLRRAAEVPGSLILKLCWNSFRRNGALVRYLARFPDDLLARE